jgi:hypothetical protein
MYRPSMTIHRFLACALWLACAGCPARDETPGPAPAPTTAATPVAAGDTNAAAPAPDPAPDPAPGPKPTIEPLLAPALAERLPASGLMLAASGDGSGDGLSIYRLDRTGLHPLRRGPWPGQMVWADPRTLVALHGGTFENRDVTIRTYVDAGEPAVQEIANDGGPEPGVPVPGARLIQGRDGEVWLQRCMDTEIRRADENNIVQCERTVYRRVHPPSPNSDLAPDTTKPPAAPAAKPVARVEPPADIKLKRKVVTLQNQAYRTDKHEVFTCTSPSGTAQVPPLAEPAFDVYKARSVRWLRQSPPIYMITGSTRSLMGEKGTREDIFVGCDPAGVAGYLDLGDGIWAWLEQTEEQRPDGSLALPEGLWHVHVDETAIARVPGLWLVAP